MKVRKKIFYRIFTWIKTTSSQLPNCQLWVVWTCNQNFDPLHHFVATSLSEIHRIVRVFGRSFFFRFFCSALFFSLGSHFQHTPMIIRLHTQLFLFLKEEGGGINNASSPSKILKLISLMIYLNLLFDTLYLIRPYIYQRCLLPIDHIDFSIRKKKLFLKIFYTQVVKEGPIQRKTWGRYRFLNRRGSVREHTRLGSTPI